MNTTRFVTRYHNGYNDGAHDAANNIDHKIFTPSEGRILGNGYILGYEDGYMETIEYLCEELPSNG